VVGERSYFLALQRPDGWPNEIIDGPHSSPEGVAKAMALHDRIFGRDEAASYVMVEAQPVPEITTEINEEAADECARLVRRLRQ